MHDFDEQFSAIIKSAEQKLRTISEPDSLKSSAPGKWCCREILGHLIDSAINNTRRFIIGQTNTELIFDGYDQDFWVSTQKYNQQSWHLLIETWRRANLHIVNLMQAIPEEVLNKPYDVHNLDQIAWRKIPANEPATLVYLISDYFDHLKYHLNQIFDLHNIGKIPID